jgi:hypothetical protein
MAKSLVQVVECLPTCLESRRPHIQFPVPQKRGKKKKNYIKRLVILIQIPGALEIGTFNRKSLDLFVCLFVLWYWGSNSGPVP